MSRSAVTSSPIDGLRPGSGQVDGRARGRRRARPAGARHRRDVPRGDARGAAERARAGRRPAAVAIAHARSIEVEDGVTTLDGRDVSAEIRGPEVTAAVSAVSAHPPVREILVARQRAWVDAHGGGVVEGRDIGTVVFPDAAVKVFLAADDEERARRRQRDERDADRDVAVEAVQDALARRDALDSSRAASPLRAADDAVVIDTTDRTRRRHRRRDRRPVPGGGVEHGVLFYRIVWWTVAKGSRPAVPGRASSARSGSRDPAATCSRRRTAR